ncbi:hypothetical protein J6590_019649 [Homalodisca vitripennis]|nr:hypothetical protein J6590_019649 [Homalodisca vitripennis]
MPFSFLSTSQAFVDYNMTNVILVCLLPLPINVLRPPFSFVSTSPTFLDYNMSPSYVTLVCLLPPPINVLPDPLSFVSTSQTFVDNNMTNVPLVCLLPPPINALPPLFSFLSTSQTFVDNNMTNVILLFTTSSAQRIVSSENGVRPAINGTSVLSHVQMKTCMATLIAGSETILFVL